MGHRREDVIYTQRRGGRRVRSQQAVRACIAEPFGVGRPPEPDYRGSIAGRAAKPRGMPWGPARPHAMCRGAVPLNDQPAGNPMKRPSRDGRDRSPRTPSPSPPRSTPSSVWRVLIGRPLRFAESAKEEIGSVEGLSALSLDALTSVAYGPEAILIVLAGAGVAVLGAMLPITVAIVVLLAILVVSYRQVIGAYPGGGGAYAVTKDNFPRGVSLVAGAALIVDYTLTVAVSIAAGVGALTSAFPSLTSATVPICLGILAVITVLNLRGLGETARAFLLPTMLFIVGLLVIIAIGLIHPLALNAPQPGHSLLTTHGLQTVGVLLVL